MAQNYVLLERIELNASAASVTFSNIPQSGYTDLKVVMSVRGTEANVGNAQYLSINGSSGSTNFTGRFAQGNGATAYSGTNNQYIGDVTNANATANTFSSIEVYFPNYTSSNNKSYSMDAVTENNATTAYATIHAGLWSQTAAITSLGFSPAGGTYVLGSTFSLYGLAAVGTTPAIAPKASGGNIDYDGTYFIHTFLSTGTFTPFTALSCDYLVVAGGGGGGNGGGGGGGAGGLRSTVTATGGGGTLESAISVTAQAYTITVGAGAAAQLTNDTRGNDGNDSSISGTGLTTITSVAGGGGGSWQGLAGKTGGSGGGGGSNSNSGGAGGSGTANQGYAGATAGGFSSPPAAFYGGGGGGGAGAAGSTNNGGNGVATSISGSSVTYGGGGTDFSGNGTAGTGGGGTYQGGAGTANRGGGGGGSNSAAAGAGGSGIVIIRYAMA
jgi:hypothetical protein